MNVSDLFNQTPAERNAAMRKAGQPTHLGPKNPDADAHTSTERARAAVAALYYSVTAPKWGRRRA